MSQHHIVTGADQPGDRTSSGLRVPALRLDGSGFILADQGIPAQGNDDAHGNSP
jgi:hypothetical protein